MVKQALLGIALMLAVAEAPAQLTLDAALDSLEKLQLITQLEKTRVLRNAEYVANNNDYSRRDELLGILVYAKMFSTGRGRSITSIPATVIPRSIRRINNSPFCKNIIS